MPVNISGANHQHRFLQVTAKRSSLLAQACKKNLGLYTQRSKVLILEGKGSRIWPSPQTENSI